MNQVDFSEEGISSIIDDKQSDFRITNPLILSRSERDSESFDSPRPLRKSNQTVFYLILISTWQQKAVIV